LEVLSSLGIDPQKEGEVYHLGRKSRGRHSYGGWFHFVGSLETTGDFAPVRFSPGFITWMCRAGAPHLSVLDGLPLVQVEFAADDVPWVIKDKEPR
jgi:hypothetical protein